jgi:Arc/MetJ family transcription regulator
MKRRTTVELDEELLGRAQRALGCDTMRATIEEALRRAAGAVDDSAAQRSQAQLEYLQDLQKLADLDVLASDEMWR